MLFNKNKNPHPAASGRFATYDEIVSNFGGSVYNPETPAARKAGLRPKNFYYFIAALAVSLILSVTVTLLLNSAAFFSSAAAGRFSVSAEYIALWILFFTILIFAGNKINPIKIRKSLNPSVNPPAGIPGGSGFKLSGKNPAAVFKQDKPFELGILKGAGNKAHPDILIGLGEKKRFEHTLIVSPTGGGKTSRYIIPGIAADAGYPGASVFAIDIDGPYLYESVKNDWIKAGKRIVYFDPFDYGYDGEGEGSGGITPSETEERKKTCFNPLLDKGKNPLSDEKLFDLSAMLFHLDKNEIKGGDVHAHKYYSKRSSDLFYGALLYLKYGYGAEYFDLPTVKAFFERGVKFIENEIVKFNGGNSKKIKNLFNNFLELPVYERAKVVTDILNNLDFLNGNRVGNPFKCKEGGDCFFIGDFFAQDMIFIAGIPKEKINSGGSKLISFITRIFINAIYENRRKMLKSLKPENLDGNNNLVPSADDRSIFIYLDEFPVLTLDGFDTELANLRKTGTGVCLTVQDTAFLKDRYGDISLITSNIGTHIVMGHAGWETCKYYSEMLGERYVLHKEPVNRDVNPAFAPLPVSVPSSFSETPVASGLYPLISPDELKNMDRGSVFIYTKYINPFILDLKPQ